jgi:hypothetical protein
VPVVADATATLSSMNVDDGIEADPVCILLTLDTAMNAMCLGCVGWKGENIFTKLKIVSGELGTCSVNLYTKKAVVNPNHTFFQDNIRQVAYSQPALDMHYGLAGCVWDMKMDILTRVQFRELV